MTPLQKRVYAALQTIPQGKVTTYGELARYVRCKSAQAIGQILKRNPNAPEVPCHRVIKSSGKIGGYQGQQPGTLEVQQKSQLLRQEGVVFIAPDQVSAECIYRFELQPNKI